MIIYLVPMLPSGSSEPPLHESPKMNPAAFGLLLHPGKCLAVSPSAARRRLVSVRNSRITPDGRYPLPCCPVRAGVRTFLPSLNKLSDEQSLSLLGQVYYINCDLFCQIFDWMGIFLTLYGLFGPTSHTLCEVGPSTTDQA